VHSFTQTGGDIKDITPRTYFRRIKKHNDLYSLLTSCYWSDTDNAELACIALSVQSCFCWIDTNSEGGSASIVREKVQNLQNLHYLV